MKQKEDREAKQAAAAVMETKVTRAQALVDNPNADPDLKAKAKAVLMDYYSVD